MFSPPHLQVREAKSTEEVTCPWLPDGEDLVVSDLVPGNFPVTHILLGKPRKAKSILPPVKLETQPGLSWSKLPIRDRTRETPGWFPLSGWLWSPCCLAQRPWAWKFGFGTRPPTSKTKGWQARLSRRRKLAPPLCVALNFYCELIFKVEKYSINLK